MCTYPAFTMNDLAIVWCHLCKTLVHPATDGDNQLIESNVVSEYLDAQYKSTGTKLFPEDPLQLAKVFTPWH